MHVARDLIEKRGKKERRKRLEAELEKWYKLVIRSPRSTHWPNIVLKRNIEQLCYNIRLIIKSPQTQDRAIIIPKCRPWLASLHNHIHFLERIFNSARLEWWQNIAWEPDKSSSTSLFAGPSSRSEVFRPQPSSYLRRIPRLMVK